LSIDDRQRVIDALKEIGECNVDILQRKLDLDKPIPSWKMTWGVNWAKYYPTSYSMNISNKI
jgi:hypothetical protein